MQQVPERHLEAGFPLVDEFSRCYTILLHAADVAARRRFPELLQELSKLLHELFDFNFLNYSLHDEHSDEMHIYMLDEILPAPLTPLHFSLEDSPAGWVWAHQETLVISDLSREERFGPVLDLYTAKGIRSLMVLPMTTARRRLGSLSFGSVQPTHCDAGIVHFLARLAALVALALENYLFLESPFLNEATAGEQTQLQQLAVNRLELAEKSTARYESLRREREQLETIIEILSAMGASPLDLRQMFPAICRSLHKAIEHDAAVITLLDKEGRNYDIYAVESKTSPQVVSEGMKIKAEESFASLILAEAKDGDFVRRKELEQQAPRYAHARRCLEAGLVSWCIVPMRTPNRVIGMFSLGSRSENAFNEKDLVLLRELAAALALSLANAESRTAVQTEKERLNALLEVSQTLSSGLDWKKLLYEISTCVRKLTAPDHADLAVFDATSDLMRIYDLDSLDEGVLTLNEKTAAVLDCPAGIVFRTREAKIFEKTDLEAINPEFSRKILAGGIRKLCCVPLIRGGQALGSVSIGSTKTNAFEEGEIDLLQQIAPQIAVALENSRAYGEVSSLKDKLTKEKVYLEQEISDSLNLEEFVGQSSALTRVLEQVKTVAPSTATVLILGETGTGKELIARAIHRMSSRASANFVKVNCAAIPTGLLESELFGHEKGAFTGAVTQKIGRLELADKGTLFLDEVGEIPMELQPKLLRALQDQEFERLGGTRTIRVNVRVIAATNRDLAKAVNEHEFRADLYYRLHVFPIRTPALRERCEDIPVLARHFVEKFSRQMNKQIFTISPEAMRVLKQWHWPGNIRELENFMERSVILTEGTTLHVPAGELCAPTQSPAYSHHRRGAGVSSRATLEELEREYILQTLRESGGVISGSRGAAARLGMKRTTLQSKIQRLKIRREEYGC